MKRQIFSRFYIRHIAIFDRKSIIHKFFSNSNHGNALTDTTAFNLSKPKEVLYFVQSSFINVHLFLRYDFLIIYREKKAFYKKL